MEPSQKKVKKESKLTEAMRYIWKKRYLYILLLPCVAYFIIFHYIPMYGVTIAFKDFNVAKGILGSPWVGLNNFKAMFAMDDFYNVFKNSISLSLLRLFMGFPAPIILALLLNEFKNQKLKKFTQTAIYLPHFISWVVIGGILVNFLSPTWGVVNTLIKAAGREPIFFMAEKSYFKWLAVFTTIWKESGWGTILYLAALTSIDPALYEAAEVDGAGKIKRLWYITLPSIAGTIVLLFVLRTGTIMNNGFEQIMVLQNSANLDVSEVFETYTYRVGILGGRYSFATTVGLFTSVIGLIMIMITNKISKLIGEQGIW